MKIEIDTSPTPFALHVIAADLRPEDRHELAVTREIYDAEELVRDAFAARHTYLAVVNLDDVPIFAFGAVPLVGRSFVQGWAFGRPGSYRVLAAVTRHIKKLMIPRLIELGVQAVQVLSHPDHVRAHIWLRQLGFRLQARVPGIGPRKEEMFLFIGRAP